MLDSVIGGPVARICQRYPFIAGAALAVLLCACSSSGPSKAPPDARPEEAGELPLPDRTQQHDFLVETAELPDTTGDDPVDTVPVDLNDVEVPMLDAADGGPDSLDADADIADAKAFDEVGQGCEGIITEDGDCCDPAAVCNPEGGEPHQCGSDGCGGSCGECEVGWLCDEAGQCNADCDWWCQSPECGTPVEGCECGTCTGCGETCIDGTCQFTACADQACGSDGCGGFCGMCDEDLKCDGGTCIPKSMTWVVIPPGDFIMGCVPGDIYCDTDEHPAHPVTVSGFEMLETSVTESQYAAMTPDAPDPSCKFNGAYGANYPVECIDWVEAKAFCLAVGGRMCTEAEWEYAARAGTTTKYYCGDDEACLEDIAWTGLNSGEKKKPVKLKLPNAFGLYDMLGNVMDWVEDCWHGTYAAAPAIGFPAWMTNCSSDYRVLRGGSWLHPDPHLLRASSRYPYPTDVIFNFLGVRCCRSID